MLELPNQNLAGKVSVVAALLGSTALGGFGVFSAFGEGVAKGDPGACAGLAIAGLALLASETGAVAFASAIAKDGFTIPRGALFAFFTVVNMTSGHWGAEAINTRVVAPQRAPYEAAVSSAAALVEAAHNSQDAMVSRQADERAQLERAIEAERQAAQNFVTSRGRQARDDRSSLATQQQAERETVDADLASAQRAKAEADARMAEAPKGLSTLQKIGFAVGLELLKGLLVLVTAPRRRRVIVDGAALPIEPAAYREMDEADLNATLSRGRAASALAQHELRRRRTANAA